MYSFMKFHIRITELQPLFTSEKAFWILKVIPSVADSNVEVLVKGKDVSETLCCTKELHDEK